MKHIDIMYNWFLSDSCTAQLAGIKDPGKTGNLEVRVVGGKLLHSKIGGAGFVDTDEKMAKIIEGVEEAMAANW